MPTRDEYQFCARLGMTQAETARHLSVSKAAVSKATARHNLTFGQIGITRAMGERWEMKYNRYPWDDMAVGDYVETTSCAALHAFRASKRYAPKRFTSITRGHASIVARAA
jgi:hypothetical protein